MTDSIEEFKEYCGININKITMNVLHKNLKRVEESEWKRICPACNKGLLLVLRNLETFKLEKIDHCILCGQRVEYLDIEEMRQRDEI